MTDRYRPVPVVDAPPEGGHVVELLAGRFVRSPRPAGACRASARHLFEALHLACHGLPGGGAHGPGGWRVMAEPELHLGPHVLVPDVAAWTWQRLPEPPGLPYVAAVPDWVCEVVDAETRETDCAQKLPIYAAFGVPVVWLVDLGLGEVTALHHRDGALELAASAPLAAGMRLPPFAHVALDLGPPDEADTQRTHIQEP